MKVDESHTSPSNLVILEEHRRDQKFKTYSGGTGGGGNLVDVETKRYVDAKMETVTAQNDARFTEVLSKLDAIKAPTIWQIAGVVAASIGFVFAILAYASDRFDGGLAAGVILEESKTNATQIKIINENSKVRDEKLDKILILLDADAKLK